MNLPNIFLVLCSLSLIIHNGVDCKLKKTNQKYQNVNVVLTGAERDAKIELLLKDPKATFYTEDGGIFNYYDSTDSGCKSIKERLTSMQISESCVRVFPFPYCRGRSQALYPKPGSEGFIDVLASWPDKSRIGSIGPCLPNEFKYATLFLNGPRTYVTKNESNVHQVPDFAAFDGSDSCLSNETGTVYSPGHPIWKYCMDHDRVKYIRADIRNVHLENGTETTESTTGTNFIIPPLLGGPRNETYNTFPQSLSKFVEWKKLTDKIEPYIREHSDVDVEINVTFAYDGASATRSYGFYYQIVYCYKFICTRIIYGFIEN